MGETDKSSDKGYRPRFFSEFSMGSLDFERYNDHLKYIEQCSGNVNSCAIPELYMIQNFFSGLNTLHTIWRPVAFISIPSVTKEVDDLIEETKLKKRNWERADKNNLPYSKQLRLNLADKLNKIHILLMEIKQAIGLGIVIRKNLTDKEKIKKGIGRGRDKFSNLPES